MGVTKKGPRILGIRPWGAPNAWAVKITQKQFLRVPEWVHCHLHYFYTDSPQHVEIISKAKDEIEAAIRFQKMWAGLPKEGE